DDAGVYLYRRRRCRSCPRAPQWRATDPGRERMPLLPRAPRPVLAACRHARSPPGPDADSQRLAVARCRSAPAGFQTADIFLHRPGPGRVPVGTGTGPGLAALASGGLDFDHPRHRSARRGDPHLEHAVRVLRLHLGAVDALGEREAPLEPTVRDLADEVVLVR